jgi:hypothetical protein
VEFSTDDLKLARMLEGIAAYPEQSSCRHELQAALYGFLHDKAIRDAQTWRGIEREHELRQRKREERRMKKEAEQSGDRE